MEDCCCSVYGMAAWYCPNTIQKLDSKPSRKKIFFFQKMENYTGFALVSIITTVIKCHIIKS